MHLSWHQCADVLLISRTTLRRRCCELGVSQSRSGTGSYSCISDVELDAVVQRLAQDYPRCGTIMIWGHLRNLGVMAPRKRVHESLLRTNRTLVMLCATTTVGRRAYSVASSNALWHIDGLHCLVRWRIVVHGGIDGFSCRTVYLEASTNRAQTVLSLFLQATRTCGWPSRVRSDQGGEKVDVARAMITCRGIGRSSHIAGSSVHNQRFERLWRDTFRCVCHVYYSLFYQLEESGLLSPYK